MVALFDWKIILTVLITLVALLVALGNHPVVKEFFAAVNEKLSVAPAEEDVFRNISFNVTLDSREYFAANTNRKINITINATAVIASAKETNVNTTNREMRLRGYTGYIALNGSNFEINGSFERFEISDVFVINGPVYASGSFDYSVIEGLAMNEFKTKSSGFLVSGGNEISFKEGLKIEFVIGRLVFYDKLTIEGLAKKISAGQIVIV